ncbi:CDP-glycerol glycerophosphotransferase family protein [Actinopolymorpha sp. B11F2]|uniref:CDP-glycerol glycerophosphotransferase family protein n=1 Tax=Actinopolymorpha sp. B11F2 TaxID=3160862 RepID=UPI0032E49C34
MQTIQVTERVPSPRLDRTSIGLAAGLGAAYAVLVVAALVPLPVAFLPAALLVTALEVAVGWRAPFLAWAAGRVGAGAPWRGLLYGLSVVVLLARSDSPSGWFVTAVAGVLAVVTLRAGGMALSELVHRQRRMPVVTRGLSLAPVEIPSAPHPVVGQYLPLSLGCPDVLLAAGAALGLLSGAYPLLLVGAVLAVTLVAVATGLLGFSALAMRRVTKPRLEAAVNRALDKVAPEVALYFGGAPQTLYQLEMWVETLERLDVPALLILRDRESLRALGPTRIPVLCIEHGTVLMGQPLPQLRVAMYVAHSANNLHLLRRKGVRHVFIGHGDSDKAVTTNPFLKAYDEIWVAGPGGRERFRTAGLDIDDSRVLEIGRPQLDALVTTHREVQPDQLTVVYAPTWEGYGDEPHQSSLGSCGATLVQLLLAEPDVRIIYRPHPLAGTRDPAVVRAHREILDLLGAQEVPAPVAPAEAYAHARDDLEVARSPVLTSRAEQLAALEVWAAKQLAPYTPALPYAADAPESTPEPVHRGHVVAPGPHFSVQACFAAADVLLSDVSSLITDFLASGRPYAVTNPAGLSGAEFVGRYPSSRGGYLVDPDGHGLASLLAAGRGSADPAVDERTALREQLLGPPEPPALERMRQAVTAKDRCLT